jgi:hypothetical protein
MMAQRYGDSAPPKCPQHGDQLLLKIFTFFEPVWECPWFCPKCEEENNPVEMPPTRWPEGAEL